jgi:hypothetical protein
MESQALRVVSEPDAAIGIAEDPASAFHVFELENMLMRHARWATRLAGLASDVETRWWAFARDAEAGHIPAALGIIGKIDRMRAGLADEAARVAEILHGVPRSRMNVTVRDSNVLLTPTGRREGQAR